MTAVLLGSHAAGSPEWHQLRAQGIGGSEIAAVVGLSPWVSAFELWHRRKGNLPDVPVTEPMHWGSVLEPIVCEEFDRRHPELSPYPAATFAHDGRSWQIANADRLVYHEATMDYAGGHGVISLLHPYPTPVEPVSLLEVKTSRFPDGWGKSGTSEIPLHYRCQVMWYMDVLDVSYAWVAVLIGGNEYREYLVDYDEADAKTLRDAGEAFWRSVQADDEPPIDCSDSTLQTVRALHPDITDDTAPIPVDVWGDYLTTRQLSQKYADDHRGAKSRVLAAMGTARIGTVADTPVLRRQPSGHGGVSLHMLTED